MLQLKRLTVKADATICNMKIRIPHANKLKTLKKKIAPPTMEQVVEQYLNGPILVAIQNAKPSKCVNIAIPTEGYEDSAKFYAVCAAALKPLGYKAEQSHDGGGMYSTLCVSWK